MAWQNQIQYHQCSSLSSPVWTVSVLRKVMHKYAFQDCYTYCFLPVPDRMTPSVQCVNLKPPSTNKLLIKRALTRFNAFLFCGNEYRKLQFVPSAAKASASHLASTCYARILTSMWETEVSWDRQEAWDEAPPGINEHHKPHHISLQVQSAFLWPCLLKQMDSNVFSYVWYTHILPAIHIHVVCLCVRKPKVKALTKLIFLLYTLLLLRRWLEKNEC